MISVIMPVFNAERFLKEAIQSILKQTYTDLELIVVDDASTDSLPFIMQSFSDKRVRYVKNEKRVGVACSLNRGLQKARGEHIARMDADDIASSKRFEQQIAFLKQHPEVGVVGTWVRIIDENEKKIGYKKYPTSSYNIARALIFENPLNHSSVMFRKNLMKQYGGYDEQLNGAEDYDLWLRYAKRSKLANIGKPLLNYRITKSSVSYRNMNRVQTAFIRTKFKAVQQYGYPVWHLLPVIKASLALALPMSMRQKLYATIFRY